MNNINAIIFDVDGTLTDGKIYIGEQGELMKAFDVKDGYAIRNILPEFQIVPIIITARTSKIMEKRCDELKIKYLFQGCRNKLEKMKQVAEELQIYPNKDGVYKELAYIGDDLIDIQCMEKVGIVGCPADAVDEVKKISDFVSKKNGGDGAVREFIEWILKENSV